MTYLAIAELARGGFGVVETVRASNGSLAARKRFDPLPPVGSDAAQRDLARKRFVREARTQSAIEHQNIMPIIDAGLDDDEPWYIMPLATESYRAQVERDRTAKAITLEPLLDILAGLEELHRLGYVHRDLRGCYGLMAAWTTFVSMMDAKARKCRPRNVSGERS